MLAAVFRLPEDTQEVLRAASVGGERTSQALLAAVTGMGPAELLAALRPAVAADVIEVGPQGQDWFAFRHSLTGEALHHDLLPGEHTRMHQRFAAALQADPSLTLPGRAAFEQAHHWQHAHDPAQSLASAWQAAASAGRMLGCAERLAMLTRVLELWSSIPAAGSLTGTSQAHVQRQAATAARAAGHLHLSSALASSAPASRAPASTAPADAASSNGTLPSGALTGARNEGGNGRSAATDRRIRRLLPETGTIA
jgi:hypothetical protein